MSVTERKMPMPKVVFFSNYINHHQLPFSKQMVEKTNGNYFFVSQKAISEKRIALGYKNISDEYDFVVKTYESDEELKRAYRLGDEADYVLFGSSNGDYIKNRIKNNKITFKYSERLFKKKTNFIREFHRVYVNHTKYAFKPLYMLCAGAYAAYDFNKYFAYRNKTYKWAYFTDNIKYDVNELMSGKNSERVNILWAGRLIDWKHPELAVEVAKRLKSENYDFELDIIGQGVMEEEIKSLIDKYELNDNVKMLGSMSPNEVREHMEKANIYLFTSDFGEGWGAVLNEAMNSGCACVSNYAIGSTGFLIKHKENGLIYKEGDFENLYSLVKSLMDDEEYRTNMGINAYRTIDEVWNAEVAAERFLTLCKCLEEGKDTPYEDGPCSKAYPVKQEEMYDYLVK